MMGSMELPGHDSAHSQCLVSVKATKSSQGSTAPLIVHVLPHSFCRQNHSKPGHGAVETWYGSPTPPYAPNHKLMATEQEKSLLSGESERGGPGGGLGGGGLWVGVLRGILTVAQLGSGPLSETGTRRAGASRTPWGDCELPSPRPGLAHHQHLCPSFHVTSDSKEEGLEAQISRLAELIGRLENKVRSLSPHL